MVPRKIIKKFLYLVNRNPISKSLFKQEIAKRAKMSVSEIVPLSKPISMFSPFTNEIHPVNDWYGHAKIFKQYVEMPDNYKFKFIIEHAPYLTEQVSDMELETDLPSFLTSNDFRVNALKKYKDTVFNVGPFIHYSPHYYSQQKIKEEKKRLGKNILVFPAHSLKSLIMNHDKNYLLTEIKKIAKNYKSIRVCLYWIDISLGFSKYYQQLGFECVTAGHILDPNFLPRLKSMIEISDLTLSNDAGTHVGYSVYMNKPHIIFYKKPSMKTSKKWQELTLDYWSSKPYQDILREFTKVSYKITPNQKQIVNQYYGGKDNIKTPLEFKKIINSAEKIYRKRYFKD